MAKRERGMAILYQTYGREEYATYACPYCRRYVHKINGRHICARRAVKTYVKAKKAVRHATTHELVMQAAVRRQAVVEIMATIVVAMHRSFGWSTDRLLRLRKKCGYRWSA